MKSEIFFTNLENFDKKDTSTGCTDGDTFGQALTRYMDEGGIGNDKLSEATGISIRTLIRYKNGEAAPSTRIVVLISIYAHLHITRVEYLMKLGGCAFNGSQEHSLWYMLVGMSYASSLTLEQCNSFLVMHGYEPLTLARK